MVAVLEALDSSDSVALNSPRRARVVDEAGLEEIEMCDAGLAGVELRACEQWPVSNQWRPVTCRQLWRRRVRPSFGESGVTSGSGAAPLGPGSASLWPGGSRFSMDFE